MYLGIDLGTSEIKTLVIDTQGEIAAASGAKLSVQRPQPHWAEQDPQSWWLALETAIGELRGQMGHRWRQIRAIGLSGQMHGAVVMDDNNRVLRPCILWNDTRSAAECAELTESVRNLHKIAGNLAMPGFTAPKLLWLARHEPDIFARITSVLLPKDYLRWRLCGEKITDMSDAAGTLWLDVAKRDWSDSLLADCGLTRDNMPRLTEGSQPGGSLQPEIAERWGLQPGIAIAGGGGDNAASAVGLGAVDPGDAFISLGTSGVLFAVNDCFRPAPASAVHAFCHALPNRWHQMSVMLTAAASLRWLCGLVNAEETELLAEVAALSREQQLAAPLFLPYLSGERTPHNDPQASGAFCGLTHATDRAALAYSVLEGVAFGIADGLQALREAGTTLAECSLTGGGARSAFWAQLIADTLDLPIVTHPGGETGGALGAARLGWLADGGETALVCRRPAVLRRYLPDGGRHQQLQRRLAHFRLLYRQQCEARAAGF